MCLFKHWLCHSFKAVGIPCLTSYDSFSNLKYMWGFMASVKKMALRSIKKKKKKKKMALSIIV